MKARTKKRISNLMIWVMIATIGIIVLWFTGFIISLTFQLHVFNERTTVFFGTLLGAAFAIVACSAFLNISLDISIISDSKLTEEDLSAVKASKLSWKLVPAVIGFLSVFSALLFLGDWLSSQNERNKLVTSGKELLNRYAISIDKLGSALSDKGQKTDIPDILKFLEGQKTEFPNVILITRTFKDNQAVYLFISSYFETSNLKKLLFNNSYYHADPKELAFLDQAFRSKPESLPEAYYWSKEDDYKLYIPIQNHDIRFILVLNRYNRYGKFGS